MPGNVFLGLQSEEDPSAAVVIDGNLMAFSEEERHCRLKHATKMLPIAAARDCFELAGVSAKDITHLVINWDIDAFAKGGRAIKHNQKLRSSFNVDAEWRRRMMNREACFQRDSIISRISQVWVREFGSSTIPQIHSMNHHYVHALHSFTQSGFRKAICLTVDGQGETESTVIWACEDQKLLPIESVPLPFSLGWFYRAATEYLGFDAFDGEYKVMGLAAIGSPSMRIRKFLDKLVYCDGATYKTRPELFLYGSHSFSPYFSDQLADSLDCPPRARDEKLTEWHADFAYEVQRKLEVTACHMIEHAVARTGIPNICISGGVGLNIKMNTAIFEMAGVNDVFANPLCSDSGAAAGAALAGCFEVDGVWPKPAHSLALGFGVRSTSEVERALKLFGVSYLRPDDICLEAARLLSEGKIIGWFQGRMEAGPRALGHRSILADPRTVLSRDRVNKVIKKREMWRPFCPSIPFEAMNKYFHRWVLSRHMVLAFAANDRLSQEAPAIVHIDGTSRVQVVTKDDNRRFHELICKFGDLTGVQVLLNTSFNVAGEPIVRTVEDALRTYYTSAMDALVIEDFLLLKQP